VRNFFIVALLVSTSALVSPVMAQDAGRVDMLENQLQQLTGQVEELTFAVKQLQKQLRSRQQTGDVEPAMPVAKVPQRKLAQLPVPSVSQPDSGIEVIEETPVIADAESGQQADIVGSTQATGLEPGAKVLGSIESQSTKSEDGGFQGQVLVPLGADESSAQGASDQVQDGAVEQVSLAPPTPQALFEKSNEALLRRQFPAAADGFKKLVDEYPDHALAGSAQYWLGETFYAQGDYRTAAQNFLAAYQKYPKSRRAPDSLLKLGLSLGKLGQRDQACSSLGAVSAEYPKAVEAMKRAQAELKRAGC
jgi:tol-pal system protein YbgF